MTTQRIILGDCLDVFANEKNIPAFVSDPPANIAFMGRSWDKAHPVDDYMLPCVPRSKAHERELRSEESFIRYWATRYAMGYDIADQHAVNIVWTLPRTSHQTATALRRAGWDIKDNLVHLFGTGWAKTGNALAPGHEGWLLATKGKPDLDIDACRVPRGGDKLVRPAIQRDNGVTAGNGMGAGRQDEPGGSLPKNALLSHCEECVRVGSKSVRTGSGALERTSNGKTGTTFQLNPAESYGYAGSTESVPAWHCLAGCACGARSKWDPECTLPRCPCGKVWRWICPVAEINAQSGNRPGMSGGGKHRSDYQGGMFGGIDCDATTYADQGGSAMFFNTFQYLGKCSPSERHAGCENLYWKADKKDPFGFVQITRDEWEALPADERAQGNVHPTVKSYRLMHWLHSLTGASRILDFTAGSGTGMYTAALDGIDWLGAEVCPEAILIAEARLAFWKGLSFEARRTFMEDDIVPEPVVTKANQRSLFE